ncbi:MarR family transcriptional regulator [Pseudofrankia sp. BMG5.37]|uniref:MarR family winged helix-turn-helix transcriptional regulator n=1 Tax=Pseudofrankia sp. BMG5.37 TaxID=3050035 RepID=UPI002894C247|nr:MarR family transcriptional regulator [Pseudofrankia sp. BMG5.37]MDT3442601.1 MarR family transcriptional regulator [Pseudofrankia sp. BMG5.37]
MTNDQRRPVQETAGPAVDPRWEELADLALIISREIQFRGYIDERAVTLTQSEGMVMRYLQREPTATPSRIADATGLQRTNLSAVLRGLEGKGLVERRAQPDDRRGVIVRATERGRSNYALVRNEWAAAVSAAAGNNTSHLDSALRLLRTVTAGLVEMRPRSPSSTPAA